MYLSLNNSAFQNRSPFPGNPARFAPAEKAQTALQKLSDQIVTGQKSLEQQENSSRAAQIKKDVYIPKDSDEDPLDDELLKLYLSAFIIGSSGYTGYANELSDFRDHLKEMDNTIQDYQDIIDGKKPLEEGRTMESVHMACELAKAERKQFYEYGMTRFSQPRFNEKEDREHEELITALLGECRSARKSRSDWVVNPFAADIYSEIDRVLENVRARAEEMNQGIGMIARRLYKRGHGKYYQNLMNGPGEDRRESVIAQHITAWKREIEQVKQTPLKTL